MVTSSIICLVISAVAYFRTRSFVATAVSTSGIVSRLRAQKDNHSDTYYCPVFVFIDRYNRHEIESSTGSNPAEYAVGDKVNVLYQLRHPNSAMLDGFFDLWGVSVITGGIAAGDLLLGVGLLVAARSVKTV